MLSKYLPRAATGLAAIFAISALPYNAGAVETLTLSSCLPKTHDQVEVFLATFMKEMKKNEKTVKIDYKGGPEITPRGKQPGALKRGVLDIILCPTYYPGLVPEQRALTPSSASPMELRRNGGYAMLQEAWGKGLNAHILGWGNHGGAVFHFYLGFKPKLSKETGLDLTGYRIRSTNIYRPFLLKMGATPVNMGMTELYAALQRGLVKGFVWPEGGVAKFGWPKYIKYRVEVPFFRSSTLIMINLDKYKALSNKARKQVEAAGLYYENNSGKLLLAKGIADTKKVFESGVKKIHLDAAHAKALVDTVYGASWESMAKYEFRVDKAKLKAKLFNQ